MSSIFLSKDRDCHIRLKTNPAMAFWLCWPWLHAAWSWAGTSLGSTLPTPSRWVPWPGRSCRIRSTRSRDLSGCGCWRSSHASPACAGSCGALPGWGCFSQILHLLCYYFKKDIILAIFSGVCLTCGTSVWIVTSTLWFQIFKSN